MQLQSLSIPLSLQKGMRLFIIEIIPQILISDGHNFIEAVFTKDCINEFRKNHSHLKFSNLRDKIIYVNKWTLQIDHVNSQMEFNSFQNFTMRLIIEAFKPLMHEQLNQRLTHSATSIYRDQQIQTFIKNFRHWFAQTSLNKQAYNAEIAQAEQEGFPAMPDLKDVLSVESDAQTDTSFGAKIQNTQVYRLGNGQHDFNNVKNIASDSTQDIPQLSHEILRKKDAQMREFRFQELDRLIIQERGEQYYAEKKITKSKQWLEQVEDEYRREQLRMKIEYFQIGNSNQLDYEFHFETQSKPISLTQKRAGHRGNHRIIGYTLDKTAADIKSNLLKLLNCSKKNADMLPGLGKSPNKPTRPRANSQENILQLQDHEDSKSNLMDNKFSKPRGISREPLSQFISH